jgi:c-di-GMP phosphodiesterase
MSAPDSLPFPLVHMHALANERNAWVALALRVAPEAGALERVFGYPDVFAALAPLDLLVCIADPAQLSEQALACMRPERMIFCLPGAVQAAPAVQERCRQLRAAGFRFMQEGAPVPAPPAWVDGVALECAGAAPAMDALGLAGPHWAHSVESHAQLKQWRAGGFHWFSGAYAQRLESAPTSADCGSRKHLLALLAMLARDADTRELETQLKQDPGLSYQLLRLANSAAYGMRAPISTFSQAITVLGRRQLQRWLQLLLYARAQEDGLPSLLLPQAALRAAQMEMLCRLQGGSVEEQDAAFMTGVFSLLDVLLGLPMRELVGALKLPSEVASALLERQGRLGHLLQLAELPAPDLDALRRAEADPEIVWQSLLQGYHWAIQVNRNL